MKLGRNICPRYQLAAGILGKRWTGVILTSLVAGPKRFGELAGELEVISDRVLAARLRELEHEGIVSREVTSLGPVRVTYRLTEKGRGLKKVVLAIARWAEAWVEIRPARRGARPS